MHHTNFVEYQHVALAYLGLVAGVHVLDVVFDARLAQLYSAKVMEGGPFQIDGRTSRTRRDRNVLSPLARAFDDGVYQVTLTGSSLTRDEQVDTVETSRERFVLFVVQ